MKNHFKVYFNNYPAFQTSFASILENMICFNNDAGRSHTIVFQSHSFHNDEILDDYWHEDGYGDTIHLPLTNLRISYQSTENAGTDVDTGYHDLKKV